MAGQLGSRAVIDQAMGVMMAHSGQTPAEVFAQLRVISQHENRKLSAVAQTILDHAVRRATRPAHQGLGAPG